MGHVLMSTGAFGDQKSVMDALDLDLQVIVSRSTSVLGTKLSSSGRAVYAVNNWFISLVQRQLTYLLHLEESYKFAWGYVVWCGGGG